MGLDCAGEGRREVAGYVARYSDGRWRVPVVKKEEKKVKVPWGAWLARMKRAGVSLDNTRKEKLSSLLAQSWGVRESQLVGKVSVTWEVIPKIRESPPIRGDTMPHPAKMWDMANVPVIIRPLVKDQSLEDGTWVSWVKEEWVNTALRIQKRMSAAMFRMFMKEEWALPLPVFDNVHPRYGTSLKKQASQWLLDFFGTANLNLKKYTSRLLWLERRLGEGLRGMFAGLSLGL